MMLRQALVPAEYSYSDPTTRTFSLGITAMGSVWMSGCTAGRLDRGSGKTLVEGTLVEQAGVALEKTRIVLAAGGLGLADIVTLVQYVPPAALAEMPALFALYAKIFPSGIPQVNTIVVRSLLRGRALIEIESVAGRDAKLGLEYLPAVSGGDLAQARQRADVCLRDHGLNWDNVVRATALVTGIAGSRESQSGAMQIVMPRVFEDEAGAQLQLTASRGRSGPVLFMSAEGDPTAGGVVEQCREIYARIGEQLAAAGSSLDAVVKTTEFVIPEGIAEYRRTADVRREVFSLPYPAATGVICDRLAHPGAQIAVEIVALRGQV